MSDSRMRNVVFTLNNYPPDYCLQIESLPKRKYTICAKEVGDSGTPHIQGYIEFANAVSLKRLKKSMPKAYFAERKGTAEQAAEYCKKTDKEYYEEGTISAPGKRNDLDTVRDILKTGGERDVADLTNSMAAMRFAQCYLKVKERSRSFKPTVIWIFGLPGTGKTRLAKYDTFRLGYFNDTHLQCGQGKWWEGYDAHKAVIIDDIRSDFCTFTRMLNILDRYECRLENKGGSRQLLAEVMYITSPFPPDQVWNTSENQNQLLRRIDTIIELKSDIEVIIHKGDALPITKPDQYPEEEDIQEKIRTRRELGCKEVCQAGNAQDRDEAVVDSHERDPTFNSRTRLLNYGTTLA